MTFRSAHHDGLADLVQGIKNNGGRVTGGDQTPLGFELTPICLDVFEFGVRLGQGEPLVLGLIRSINLRLDGYTGLTGIKALTEPTKRVRWTVPNLA